MDVAQPRQEASLQPDYLHLVREWFQSGVNAQRTNSELSWRMLYEVTMMVKMTLRVYEMKTRKPIQSSLRFNHEKLRNPGVAARFK